MNPTLQPLFMAMRAVLQSVFGEQLAAVILFGSQARGDAVEGSDVYLRVVLKTLPADFCAQRKQVRLQLKAVELLIANKVEETLILANELLGFAQKTQFLTHNG